MRFTISKDHFISGVFLKLFDSRGTEQHQATRAIAHDARTVDLMFGVLKKMHRLRFLRHTRRSLGHVLSCGVECLISHRHLSVLLFRKRITRRKLGVGLSAWHSRVESIQLCIFFVSLTWRVRYRRCLGLERMPRRSGPAARLRTPH